MYPFDFLVHRKQKHKDVQLPGEYLLLSSEPADNPYSGRVPLNLHTHYFAKRSLRRSLRRLRNDSLR
jgi:hypothetical protein